jgi:hypothetical protein
MSRNYELLKRAELERQVTPAGIEVEAYEASRPLRPLPSEVRRTLPTAATDAVRPKIVDDVTPEISKLVQNLFVTTAIASPRVVMFSPVARVQVPDFIGAQVAEALADQRAGSIALIDCDVQAPSLHAYFSVTNDFGITTALTGSEPVQSYAHSVAGCDLTIVTAGQSTRNWQHLLAGDLMTERLRELRAHFDYVLIAAPPIAECPSMASLGQRTDGVVLIIEANDTRRDVAMRAKQQWERANSRLLGAVLNNRTFPIPDSLYARL